MKVELIGNVSKKEHGKLFWGTSSQNFYLDCTSNELKKVFGIYGKGDPYKVKVSWYLIFLVDSDEGTKLIPITIYDYKEYDTKLTDIRDWHIGNFAKDNQEVSLILNWINEKIREVRIK